MRGNRSAGCRDTHQATDTGATAVLLLPPEVLFGERGWQRRYPSCCSRCAGRHCIIHCALAHATAAVAADFATLGGGRQDRLGWGPGERGKDSGHVRHRGSRSEGEVGCDRSGINVGGARRHVARRNWVG